MNDLRETMAEHWWRQCWMESARRVVDFVRQSPQFRTWTAERYGFRITLAEHPLVLSDVWFEQSCNDVHAIGSPLLVTELRFDDWMRRIRQEVRSC